MIKTHILRNYIVHILNANSENIISQHVKISRPNNVLFRIHWYEQKNVGEIFQRIYHEQGVNLCKAALA